MRLVVTSDTHFPVDINFIPQGDVFIHCGDLLSAGTPEEWNANLPWLSQLKHKTKIIVPGNHDFHFNVYPGPAITQMREIGFIVLGQPYNEFQSIKLPNGMSVLGLPYVKNLPRWCYNADEQFMYKHLREQSYNDIVVSHSPLRGVLDVDIKGDFTGFSAYHEYLQTHNPRYWFHGHVHEEYGHRKILGTDIYNVSMSNRSKQHVNPPIVLDV